MNKEMYQQLQQDLAKAVKEKDIEKISKIRQILNISDEQAKYFEKGLTGYPSVDKVWLKYYEDGAEEKANNIPLNKTVWDVVEKKLYEHYDIPAIEYFGRLFSRKEFIDLCYTWARTFRAMGVEENEIVPIYGPFVPEICAMFFALNMIGACPYFLKLAISPQALAEETKEAKIAVVFDGMWGNVAHEFSKDKFKNVIVATATDDMPSPKKEIVSFISKIKTLKNKSKIPDEKKYIWIDKATDIANYYSGKVKVPFVKNRRAVITSSSGTTVGGVVKGVCATNESMLSQVNSLIYSDIPYEPGFRTLNHFPPTAATSLNSLFLVGLVNGATIIIDPRVSANDFYHQLVDLKPNICINTSSLFELFFNRILEEMKKGKTFDFSYAKGWMVGGEGTTVKKIEKWNQLMKECGAKAIYDGYGLSEAFSGVSIDRINVEPDFSKKIVGVGLVQAGMVTGIFNKDGEELSYNQRGELHVKTNAMMQGYYGKPELTAETIKDGWIKTKDLAELDENGFLYIWGRINDGIKLPNGDMVYLFDIANKIKEHDFIDDALVLSMPTEDNEYNLVAHIVWSNDFTEKEKQSYIELINSELSVFLPKGVQISAYGEHNTMLPYSPTTLKRDKNKMSKQLAGYIQVIDGKTYAVEYIRNQNGKYSQKCIEIGLNKVKKLKKR